MKPLLVVFIAGATAVFTYTGYYRCATAPKRAMIQEPGGEMEWLRREYHLTNEQFTHIQQIHRDYAPKCDLMCQKIAETNEELDRAIRANHQVTPEVAGALQRAATAQEECHQAMLGHIYAVSEAMSPNDGARYLQTMKRQIIQPGLNYESVISDSAK